MPGESRGALPVTKAVSPWVGLLRSLAAGVRWGESFVQIESVSLHEEGLERLWSPMAPSLRFPSPDGERDAWFDYAGEIRMGLPRYLLRIELSGGGREGSGPSGGLWGVGPPGGEASSGDPNGPGAPGVLKVQGGQGLWGGRGDPRDSGNRHAPAIPGYEKFAVTCPEGPYQPWTHDSSSLLLSLHKAGLVLCHAGTPRTVRVGLKKHWFANVSCSHSIPVAFICSRYSWMLASLRPENAYFLPLDGPLAPAVRFSLPYETIHAWWLGDGERLLVFLQDSGAKLARLQIYLSTASMPVEELDLYDAVSSCLCYDRGPYEKLGVMDRLCFEERLWTSAKRLRQWGPASYDRETGVFSLTVVEPTSLPVRKHRRWGSWTCNASVKRIEIQIIA